MSTMKEHQCQCQRLLLPCRDSLQGDSDTVLSLWHKDNLLQPHLRWVVGKAGESGLQGASGLTHIPSRAVVPEEV